MHYATHSRAFDNEKWYFQQDGGLQQYILHMSEILLEFSRTNDQHEEVIMNYTSLHRSDLTPIDFLLLRYMKHNVYSSKSTTIKELRTSIEKECAWMYNGILITIC
ncbi:hypothetical protein AVEN_76862-1 [Araneus ventricosus]|uniref:DDE-1 domain-containing protein n=1 Tax=Araneus ventricosus TaxID=182803 RepID=A0A4Y2KWF7_ARAVE|nr:hypothetical protein AVEN_76862-1 [Araneus ventricosus]